MKKRVLVIQNSESEGLGTLSKVFEQQEATVTVLRAWEKPTYPATTEFDAFVVLGGSMGVQEEKKYPWLSLEKDFLAEAIDTGKPSLGICLGAQIFAELLGANVYPCEQAELGWFPIQWTAHASELGCDSGEEKVFQWHHDTFDLPEGAKLLASSAACKNQAFLHGSILALQFHLEADAEWVAQIVKKNKADLKVAGPFVQSSEVILKESSSSELRLASVLAMLLSEERLTALEA